MARLPLRNWTEPNPSQVELSDTINDDSPFEYAPIESNQIRLLMLKPATAREEILEATMFISNFPNTDKNEWHALSYTWGNPDELPGLIVIDGRKMKITANLEAALRDLRSKDAVEVYWIDAISINQADLSEKGHQIQHIRYIYEQATSVRVWLGEFNEQTEEAIDEFSSYGDVTDEAVISSLSENEWSNAKLDVLISLFSRPYWRRVWIFQELVCGTNINVYCGRRSIPLDALLRIRALIDDYLTNMKRPLNTYPQSIEVIKSSDHLRLIEVAKMVRSMVRNSGVSSTEDNALSLWGLLHSSKDRRASNPRDKVYAMLGLVEDINGRGDVFPVDYDVSVEQLYQDTARWIIVNSGNLNILCSARLPQPGMTYSKLPSWCPDWRAEPTMNELTTLVSKETIIPAELKKMPEISFGPGGTTMTVRGICIGEYKTTTGRFDWDRLFWYQYLSLCCDGIVTLGGNYTKRQIEAIQRWLTYSEFSDPNHPIFAATVSSSSGEPLPMGDCLTHKSFLISVQETVPHLRDDPVLDAYLEKLLRTLILDTRGEENEATKTFRAMFNCTLGWKDKHIPAGLASGAAQFEFALPFQRRVGEVVPGRQLAITDTGQLGMVSVDVQVGDIVCTLFGCPLPIVLRPQGSHFIVVGDAYVDGYMSLEAVREAELGILKSRTFVLH